MYKVTKQDLQLPSLAQGNLRYLINLDQLSPRGPRAATKATKKLSWHLHEQGTEGQGLEFPGEWGREGPGISAYFPPMK